jgi:SAM-dependent methyltransferase
MVKHGNYFTIGHRLPDFISKRLFGDRSRFGSFPFPSDNCWDKWQKTYLEYFQNYKNHAGMVVNNSGYKIISKIDMTGKKVLEIGPAEVNHSKYWNCLPEHYVLADTRRDLLDISIAQMQRKGVVCSAVQLPGNGQGSLPFRENVFDLIVSFYCLEHLYPLGKYLDELVKVLKPNGLMVGAIPSEGGVAWGAGRYLTTRRWLKNKTTIDPDKIICWEHPNFAEGIMKKLDDCMSQKYCFFWPFNFLPIDLNLVVMFIYNKLGSGK